MAAGLGAMVPDVAGEEGLPAIDAQLSEGGEGYRALIPLREEP